MNRVVYLFDRTEHNARMAPETAIPVDRARLREHLSEAETEKLLSDLELLDGMGFELDHELLMHGAQTPVYFGSALTNFGVRLFLDAFVDQAPLFPQARASVMASDTITGPVAAANFVRAVEDHEIDIVIGTQIVAKGHHFPLLTLVGVVDGDLGLAGGDLRAAERSFQLLYQVAGRAGRAERPGKVLIQTADPDHPVMRALVAGDRDGFLAAETEARRRAGMPPFGRLAALIVSSGEASHADATARALARTAPRGEGIDILGPAPAPLALLRGRHRRRLLMKARRGVDVQELLHGWLAQVPLSGDVRVQVDVDPYSFM